MKLSPAFDRIAPQELYAEQAVLGCVALDLGREALAEVRGILEARDFYRDAHQRIFEAACRLDDRGEPADLLTLSSELDQAGYGEFTGGRPYLVACLEAVDAVTRASHYARMVRRGAIRRRANSEFNRLAARCHEEPDLQALIVESWALAETLQQEAQSASGEGGGFRAYTAKEILEMEIPPLVYLVPGLLSIGLTQLVGDSKIGKSFLALEIAEALATGGRALGEWAVDRCQVTYLALEDTLRRLKGRMGNRRDELLGCEGLRFVVDEVEEMGRGGLEQLRHELEHFRPRLLIIDTLARFRGRPDPKAAVYYDDTLVSAALQKLAGEFDCCLLVIHHTSKAPRSDVFQRVSGSTGLMGAADTTIMFERKRGEPGAKLSVTGRDTPDAEIAITWDDLAGWQYRGDAKELARSEADREVLEIMADSAGITNKFELAKETGCKVPAAKMRLRRMEERGLVVAVGNGRYQLAVPFVPAVLRVPGVPLFHANGAGPASAGGSHVEQPEQPEHAEQPEQPEQETREGRQ